MLVSFTPVSVPFTLSHRPTLRSTTTTNINHVQTNKHYIYRRFSRSRQPGGLVLVSLLGVPPRAFFIWSPLVRRHLFDHLLWSIFKSSLHILHITNHAEPSVWAVIMLNAALIHCHRLMFTTKYYFKLKII